MAGDPGDLDHSFGGDGRVALPSSDAFVPRAVGVDSRDRIVVGGTLCDPDSATRDGTCLEGGDANFRVARLTPDGGLDGEFGDGGFVTTAVGESRSVAFDLLLTRTGRIVVAGVARLDGRDVFALVAYRPDGSLDPAFGTGGEVLTPIGSSYASISDVAEGPGGMLLAVGQAVDGNGRPSMAIARYTPDGALDSSFGTAGATLGGSAAFNYGLAVAVAPSGSALIAGAVSDARDDRASYRFGQVRVTPDGALDRAFGKGGSAEHAVGDAASFANAVVSTGGDGWLAAGAALVDNGSRQAMAVVRGGRNGRLDRSFGRRGSTLITLRGGAVANDVLIGSAGRPVVIGQAGRSDDSYDFATVRLQRNGALDRTFGHNGAAFVRWPGYPIARAVAGAFQRSGRLVTVGLGCVGGTKAECIGGTTRLLVARQFAGADRTAPAIRVGRPKPLGKRRVQVAVGLSEPGRLTVRVRSGGRMVAKRTWRSKRAGFAVRVRLPRRLLERRSRLIVRATDVAGNTALRRFTIRLPR